MILNDTIYLFKKTNGREMREGERGTEMNEWIFSMNWLIIPNAHISKSGPGEGTSQKLHLGLSHG